MSDSEKLRFEHGIWWMIFSHIFFIGVIVFGYLGYCALDGFCLYFIAFLCLLIFIGCFMSSIGSFEIAIRTSKNEKSN